MGLLRRSRRAPEIGAAGISCRRSPLREGPRQIPCGAARNAGALAASHGTGNLDPGGFRADPVRSRPRRAALYKPHRDDVTRRDRLHQSRRLGQSARRVRPRRGRRICFKEQKIASTYRWALSPKGQHIELGIAENNLFILLAALGLSHSLFGERLIPIGTLYDPFIARGLDALNYACYQDARFILVATPSGVTLAPEGGAHQSIGTPLIGMAQDGLAAFEPAFVDELGIMLAWSFDYIQRDGKPDVDGEKTGCVTRPAGPSICASPPDRWSSQSAPLDDDLAAGHHRRRLLAQAARSQLRDRDRVSGCRCAGSDCGSGISRRGPPRRRRARGHIGGPAQCRLAGRHARAHAWPRRVAFPCRKIAWRPSRFCRPCDADRRPSRHAVMARRSLWSSGRVARRRAFRTERPHRRSLRPSWP